MVEDALSGVAAGRAGDFAIVIGVDRGAGHDALSAHGADIVVDEIDELIAVVDEVDELIDEGGRR